MVLDKKKLKIRKFSEGDYLFCYRLTKRNMFDYVTKYQDGWDAKAYREHFERDNVDIVEYNNRRIGFYNVQKREKELFLIDVQISKQHQNKGLGTYLLDVIERQAIRSKIKKLTLGVYWDNPSLNLYKRLGYKVFKKKKYFAVMCKNI
jgi:ribosomal protein S18 acetylase RimI-like enzyme